jgi:predicted transcriptional regulator
MFNNNSEIEVKNKLIILQVLRAFGVPLTNSQTTEFILENELINYFELQQYLSELIDSNMIEINDSHNEEHYYLTTNGKRTLHYFNDRLAKDLRRLINDQADSKKDRIIARTNISADYFKLDDGEYLVELKVDELDHTLINLKLNVINCNHAKLICEKWEKEAQYLYGDIFNLLVTDNKNRDE